MKIGMCGLGTVGSGVFNLLRDNAQEIAAKTGIEIEMALVGARRDNPACDLSATTVTRDVHEVVSNPDIDVVLELIGGTDTAKELVLSALANGKHVVTANKALIALHGDEVFAAAREAGCQVRYEASVAGGIPVIKAIREGLAGNRVDWLAGIINGTTNYILTEMAAPGSNLAFEDVLKEAQVLGYAEADPTFDVEGIDAAHKLTILAAVAFGAPLNFEAMYTEGISAITSEDIAYADQLGYRIRHLGIARRTEQGMELRVHPTLVRSEVMLAQVSGVMNAVMVGADAATPTMYVGPGAGAGPTASAVVADVIDLARGNEAPDLGFVMPGAGLSVLSIEDVRASYYLRMSTLDKPGVMATLTAELGRQDISIEALIQKDARGGNAEIVLVTSEVAERQLQAALVALRSLPEIVGDITMIRVADFS